MIHSAESSGSSMDNMYDQIQRNEEGNRLLVLPWEVSQPHTGKGRRGLR